MSHARLSPSNHRWPNCPGSIREEAHYPDTPGRAAIDGTGTHALLELCLSEGKKPYDYQGEIIGAEHPDMPLGWLVDPDRCDRVQMALDYIDRRVKEFGAQYPHYKVAVESETRSNPGKALGDPRDDWHGTCDITLRVVDSDNHTVYLEVVDYKDGRGWVPADNNSQLQSYAAGKLEYGALAGACVEGVRMTIVQPRTSPVIRTQEVSWNDIRKVALDLGRRAALTDDPEAPLIAGKWCQWCKANPKRGGHCTQAAKQATKEIQMTTNTTGLDGLLDLDVTNATEAQLAAILDQKPLIDAAFERVEKEVQNRLEQELPVPGWALLPGRRSRAWTDEDAVMAALKKTSLKIDDYAPRRLISPAQAEKVVSKRSLTNIMKMVEEKPGNLAPRRVSHEDKKDANTMFPVSFI